MEKLGLHMKWYVRWRRVEVEIAVEWIEKVCMEAWKKRSFA